MLERRTGAALARSLFGPDQLAKLVEETLPPASDHRVAVVGTVDRTGAQIVAGFTSENGLWHFEGAYHHDWATGDNQVAGRVMFTK